MTLREHVTMATCLRQRRWIGWKALALALALAWITGRPAQAEILVGDPNAMAGWDGSVSLSTTYSSRLLIFTQCGRGLRRVCAEVFRPEFSGR